MSAKIIILVILAILFLVFLFQNLETVSVTFLFFELGMPRSLLLIITFIIGLVIGIFIPIEFKKQKME